ncbi:HAMP domain-containing sensor histidine kinase [Microbacterium sp. 1P10UB]|uniref:sensor histidine kinase n=1 Tax=unclassified Microbacterium TaxID=2609290 RepID=UPI00399EF08C
MRRLTIRARITIGSVLVAAVLIAIALIIVRSELRTVLADADAALAQGDLQSFEADIASNPTAEVDNPGAGVLVYARSPDGRVEVDSLPRDISTLVTNRPAGAEQFPVTDATGRHYIVIGQDVPTSSGTWALWSARSTSSSELAVDGLDRVLILGGVLLLAGFGAASWVLATVTLRPVARMRKAAVELGNTLEGELPVGRARDEIAALATTLNELLTRLRTSATREKQMISDAAHELRTPLASLTTQLELACGDTGDATALETHLRGAEASAARLAALATNLLELNRLETENGREPTSSSHALTVELMGAVDRARMLGLRRSVTVSLQLPGADSSHQYRIDPRSFGRVLDNLLHNAVTAVTTGGTVEAALTFTLEGADLTVTDDGPGMPPEFLDKAFERFSRPDAGRSADAGGSGLGLALVHAIVVSAAGSVTLENQAPGFAVTVHLPKM